MRLSAEQLRKLVAENPAGAREMIAKYKKIAITLAQSDPNAFVEYVFRDDRTGKHVVQAPVHRAFQQIALEERRACIWTSVEMGKALPVDTEIPSPSGWIRMGDIQVGDEVFARDGSFCVVEGVTPVQHGRKVYEIEFDDHGKILADEDHLWLVNNQSRRDQHRCLLSVTTALMAQSLPERWAIPLTGAVQYQEQQLPIHPYAFGAWIGDGNSSGAVLTFHENDRYIYDRSSELESGFLGNPERIPGRPHLMRGKIAGMNAKLRALGVSGRKGSKRIPEMYLHGSEHQRRELLAGLLDTDGTVSIGNGGSSLVEFCSCDQRIGESVLELVRSLGFKARMRVHDAKLYGRVVGKRYRVSFTAREPVFSLPRKLVAQSLTPAKGSKSRVRYVIGIREIPTVPVRCIRVTSPDHSFLAGREYTVTHNCEVGDAQILMADGTWRRIDSLTDRVYEIMALDPARAELKKVKAGPSYSNGIKPVTRMLTDTGRVMMTTKEHPLYVRGRGWTQAQDIHPSVSGNPEVLIASHLNMPWVGQNASGLSVDEASLAGFLMDGAMSKDGSRYFTFWPFLKECQEELKRVVALMGWKLDALKNHGRIGIYASEGADTVGDIAASFCKMPNWESRSKEFKLHDALFKSSDEAIHAFLKALFSRAGRRARGGKVHYAFPISFQTASFEFAHDVQLLAGRLGGRLSVKLERAVECKHDNTFNGKAWLVTFADQRDATMFWRRADIPALATYERLKSIQHYGLARETWALPVHDDCHCYISGGVVSHNTTQLSVAHTLWRIGRDPNMSVIIVSNTKELAQKIVGQMKKMIMDSERLHDVFPKLSPGNKWAEYSFTVERDTERRDPTVQACGLRGNIHGSRCDFLILDDIDDSESTLTPAARADTMLWVQSTAFSRIGEGSRVLAVGNTWDDNDCMHTLAKLNGWESFKFPIMDERGESNWPQKFSPARIAEMRQDMGDLQFTRMCLCQPIDESSSRFRPEWIENALAAGAGLQMVNDLPNIPPGCFTITGVDLGVRQKKGSDPTALVTVMHHPDGKRELLNIESGLWSAPEIADRIVSIHHRFASTIFVEDNGAQNFIVQIVQSLGEKVPVKTFNTGRNKHDPTYGVESIAVEMSTNKWVIPSPDGSRAACHHEIRKLIEEMIVFSPARHTGDRLMALWIAREAARVKGPGKAQVGKFRRF